MAKKRIKIKYGKYTPKEPSIWDKIKNLLRKKVKCNKILIR